ncbi:hypothetical protein QFZ33_001898 [Arthrobacter globiformis]|nr:hypothetical protein [Arthrobacter globiformis]
MRGCPMAGVFVTPRCHAVGMENSAAAVGALEAIGASAAALAAELRRTDDPGLAGVDPLPDQPDPLQERANAFLTGLTEAARMEAKLAAVKVHLGPDSLLRRRRWRRLTRLCRIKPP